MKKVLLLLSLFVSARCFANLDEDLIAYRYSLVPSIGYHFGFSELSGTSSLTHGPVGALAFQVSRDRFFFAPEIGLMAMLGLEESVTLWTVGFTGGGPLFSTPIDVYGGISYRKPFAYKTDGAIFGRLGLNLNLGSDIFLYGEGLVGQFSETTLTKITNYFYVAAEFGLRFPFSL